MSITRQPTAAGDVASPVEVKVWDPFVRSFHWSLVGLFVLAFATGEQMEGVHIAVGYLIATLVAARVVWGAVGPHHARFENFVRHPSEMIANLRDVILLRAPRYLGHSPAGSAMIIALIIMTASTCMTGYMATTYAFRGAEWVEEIHEACAHAMIALVVLHVIGVLIVSYAHRESLVKAMITGWKRKQD